MGEPYLMLSCAAGFLVFALPGQVRSRLGMRVDCLGKRGVGWGPGRPMQPRGMLCCAVLQQPCSRAGTRTRCVMNARSRDRNSAKRSTTPNELARSVHSRVLKRVPHASAGSLRRVPPSAGAGRLASSIPANLSLSCQQLSPARAVCHVCTAMIWLIRALLQAPSLMTCPASDTSGGGAPARRYLVHDPLGLPPHLPRRPHLGPLRRLLGHPGTALPARLYHAAPPRSRMVAHVEQKGVPERGRGWAVVGSAALWGAMVGAMAMLMAWSGSRPSPHGVRFPRARLLLPLACRS
eukprot:120841-Rhodomonas_salina.2